ncbi:methyltransferase-like protein 27 isoform X1 [Haliotis rufescens]|uniref:methyltransferase-like protein 27 isoform X1 n=1 Tax=Haliotis rufescens TaxID=6454 RepID=UPI00201F1A7A|nr:methyltransferase-like protein 27 isoform X1 [Haliotis rufescens]
MENSTDTPQEQDANALVTFLQGSNNSTPEAIVNGFSKYSQDYEKVFKAVNFNGYVETARTAAELFPSNREDVNILDVAAGTGLCAGELYTHGFRKLDALDPSMGMLDEARKKALYNQYFNVSMGENTLDIESDTYDAVTISGMSTVILKQLPIKAFEELIRIVKPGGYIVNTANIKLFPEDGDEHAKIFRSNMKTLTIQGKWEQFQFRRFKEYVEGEDGVVSTHRVL